MKRSKYIFFLLPLASIACFKTIPTPLKPPTPLALKTTMGSMITLPQAKVKSVSKTTAGIDLQLDYSLHCAPGMAIVTGDLSQQNIERMPLTKKESVELIQKTAGSLGVVQRKKSYDKASETPKYIVLPKESAVVFDPRRLKINSNRSDLSAAFKPCGQAKGTASTFQIEGDVPIRILTEEGEGKLNPLKEAVLKISDTRQINPIVMGRIDFHSKSKGPSTEPLYFKTSLEDLAKGNFSSEIYERLKKENANAGVSAAAFGMRWRIPLIRVATPWESCGSLGPNPIDGKWGQEAIAEQMRQKSVSRRIKSQVMVNCEQIQIHALSNINDPNLTKYIENRIQKTYEENACKEAEFIARHKQAPSLKNWFELDRICGIDSVKSAISKTKATPTQLLADAIEAKNLKLAAAAMKELRRYVDYKRIPDLAKKMTLSSIKEAENNPKEALNILPYGFRGVAFGKRTIKQATQKNLLKRLGKAVDRAIVQALQSNVSQALKAHNDFGGILGKTWKQRSVAQIQKELSSTILKKDPSSANEIVESCKQTYSNICTDAWTTEITNQLKKE